MERDDALSKNNRWCLDPAFLRTNESFWPSELHKGDVEYREKTEAMSCTLVKRDA